MAKPQKVKLKKSAWIGIIITAIVLVLFVILLIPTEKETIYKTFSSNPDFTEDHIIDKVSLKKFKKLVEKSGDEPVYILFGSAEHFTETIDVFNDYAVEKGIEKLYWLDSTDKDLDEEDEIDDFGAYLRSVVGTSTTGSPLIKNSYLKAFNLAQQQDMFVAKNGKIVNRFYDIDKATQVDGASKSVEYIFKKIIEG